MKYEIPVLAVVCIIGSTEESAVDPIADVVDLRNKFKRKVYFDTILLRFGVRLLCHTPK